MLNGRVSIKGVKFVVQDGRKSKGNYSWFTHAHYFFYIFIFLKSVTFDILLSTKRRTFCGCVIKSISLHNEQLSHMPKFTLQLENVKFIHNTEKLSSIWFNAWLSVAIRMKYSSKLLNFLNLTKGIYQWLRKTTWKNIFAVWPSKLKLPC